jgi:hypothetical protein
MACKITRTGARHAANFMKILSDSLLFRAVMKKNDSLLLQKTTQSSGFFQYSQRGKIRCRDGPPDLR